jgi:hypothetical protein
VLLLNTLITYARIAGSDSAIISAIAAGHTVEPMNPVISHKELLIAVQQLISAGASIDEIDMAFCGWADHIRWTSMTDIAYLYQLHKISGELVNFSRLFLLHGTMAHIIDETATLPIEEVIEAFTFYDNYDLSYCFNESTHKTQRQLVQLNSSRHKALCNHVFNPYDSRLDGFFIYTNPSDAILWQCESLGVAKSAQIGVPTIVDSVSAQARFHQFTNNMFNGRTDKGEFPFAHVVFAGGSIEKMLSADVNIKYARSSDVDMFIVSETLEQNEAITKAVLEWFYEENEAGEPITYYAVNSSVVTIYIVGHPRKYQLVSTRAKDISGVYTRFDFTHIQCAYYMGEFWCSYGACKALRDRVTYARLDARRTVHRYIKALRRGYDIACISSQLTDKIDIEHLLKYPDSAQLKKIQQELARTYYPKIEDGYSLADERDAHIGMIAQDSKAIIVVLRPAEVVPNMVIGGTFESDYITCDFKSFSINNIVNVNQIKHRGIRPILSTHGTMMLTSPSFIVQNIITTYNSYEISVLNTCAEFAEFCHSLDEIVFKMYRKNDHVTVNIINDGIIVFSIPMARVDYQIQQGNSILRDTRGFPLILNEDLEMHDKLQVNFAIKILIADGERRMVLDPMKLTRLRERAPVVDYDNNADLTVEPASIHINYTERSYAGVSRNYV